RHASVSIATVSRVLNQPQTVTPETAQRVRAVIARLGYWPRAAARGLASGRSYAIGLITSTIAIPFFAPLLQGIEDAARQHNLNLLIHCTRDEFDGDSGYFRPLGPHNTDGLLIFAGALRAAELEYLCARDFPVVLLYQTPPNNLPIPCVVIENQTSARQLVEHLIIVHERRHIAFLKGPENQEDSHRRELGYREALARHGIALDEALIAPVGRKGSGAAEVVAQWLRYREPPDAIFAWDDDTALEVIRALQLARRRVPEDIAVVGFDDIHLAYYAAPPLTTVRTPVEQVGREAVRQLVQYITTRQAAPLTVLPTELAIRRSCGCNNERG
ncbi:MAG: LacI family DNA-binding transcriptional regulator, partial [Anaerolineae bacterium]